MFDAVFQWWQKCSKNVHISLLKKYRNGLANLPSRNGMHDSAPCICHDFSLALSSINIRIAVFYRISFFRTLRTRRGCTLVFVICSRVFDSNADVDWSDERLKSCMLYIAHCHAIVARWTTRVATFSLSQSGTGVSLPSPFSSSPFLSLFLPRPLFK